VRSSSDASLVLTDYDEWCRLLWIEALEKSRAEGVRAHRWSVAE